MKTKTTTLCRIEFLEFLENPSLHRQEASMARAIGDAEFIFGPAEVRMCGAYYIERDGSRTAVDVSTYAGECIARVFIGLMTRELGERAFKVNRETLTVKVLKEESEE